MQNAEDFRRIALGLPETVESAHMDHPDFRVNGRIFATLNEDQTRGMVVLTPDQQGRFLLENPSVFQAESGAWGRSGCTRVQLRLVDEETLGEAVTLAWQNGVAKGPVRSRAKTSTRRAISPGQPAKGGRPKRHVDRAEPGRSIVNNRRSRPSDGETCGAPAYERGKPTFEGAGDAHRLTPARFAAASSGPSLQPSTSFRRRASSR